MSNKNAYTVWPFVRLSAKRQAKLQLTTDVPGLRPLKCLGWNVVQNVEFNLHRLTTEFSPGGEKNIRNWQVHFSKMGSDANILAKTSKFEVELYRPMCLSASRHYVTFCFLSLPE